VPSGFTAKWNALRWSWNVSVVRERVVAPQLARDDAVRIRVVAHEAEVHRLAIDEHADLGLLGGGLARMRVLLDEVGDDVGLRPCLVVQHAVDADG
jgi:hypothetical protein